MTTALLFALYIAFIGIYSAWYDAYKIADDEPIDHIDRFVLRGLFAVFAAWITGEWFLLLGAWALFNLTFRPVLNRLRGLHWNYISPSNLYDWMFLRPFMRPIDRTECVEGWHVYMASISALNAGRIAYAVELAVVILVAYLRAVL